VRKIAVIGLGYVGLPVAVAFSRKFHGTLGYDSNPERVAALQEGRDWSGEVAPEDLRQKGLVLTADPKDLADADFYIVAVPTPIDVHHRPDLACLEQASRTLGGVLRPGDLVVYESTVYPGVTEEVCGPILEETSELRCGRDFKLGYSPERINPGDREHTFESIVKVVAGQDDEALETIAACYGKVVRAGIHRAPSIKVAEAAKVIENTQRDLNIALMNELAIIFDKMNIETTAVLEAARTKWNFLRFTPGLVGGHCIGVDPYYLTSKAEQVGIHPQVILAGRRINDGMGGFVAAKVLKLLIHAGRSIQAARVGVLGITFKENVSDLRNSRVPEIVRELQEYGIEVLVHDPLADPERTRKAYGIELVPASALDRLDAVLFAVPHDGLEGLARKLLKASSPPGVFLDLKSRIPKSEVPRTALYWRL